MEKYGFVYIWRDRKHKMFYIGCHWGTEDDGYVCSSNRMRNAYNRRPNDFKRKIITKVYTNKRDLMFEEQVWLYMIPDEQLGKKYYNLRKHIEHWQFNEEKTLSVKEKISKTLTGRKNGPCSPEKADKISSAKLASFEKRKEKTGQYYDEETTQRMLQANQNKNFTHTEEWKQENSVRMKELWNNGSRKRDELIETMSREEQSELCSEQLKSRWQDPIWKENQISRLKEGAKKRPPRSEESKLKARMAQLGKPKPRKNKIAA